MLLMLIPSVIYTVMFLGQTFPETERQAAGVPFGDMFKEVLRPLFLVHLALDVADGVPPSSGPGSGTRTSSTT